MNCINNFNALCFFRLLPTLLLISLGIPIVQAQCPTDPALLPVLTPGGNNSGLLKLCEPVSGNASVNLIGNASSGISATSSFGPVTNTCSSNCIPNDNNTLSCPAWMDSIYVTGVGNVEMSTVVRTTLNIGHQWFSDLDIWLVGPGNCGTLDLSTDNGGTNNDFVNVTITTEAGFPSISTITAPSLGQLQSNATFMAENAINLPPNLTAIGNPATQFQNVNYLNTPCLGATSYVPNVGLEGCPVNGWWKLVIADDWTAISATVQNWSLSVQQNNPNYQHIFTSSTPGVVISPSGVFTGTGALGANGMANISNLPVGRTEVKAKSILGGCVSPQISYFINVYDRPQLNSFSSTCSSNGTPGTVTLNAVLDNANFTGDDIGIVQYASTLAGPWINLTGPITGLVAGTYTYYLRNSASPSTTGGGSCAAGPFTIVVGAGLHPDVNIPSQNYSCTAGSVTLSAVQVGTALPNIIYNWSPGTNTSSTYTVNPTVTTEYCVTATNASNTGCTDVACVTIPILGTTVSLSADTIKCISPIAVISASPNSSVFNYNWSAGLSVVPNTNKANAFNSGVYTVTITHSNGCFGTASVQVIGNDVALNATVSTANPISCSNPNPTLSATMINGATYNWSSGAIPQGVNTALISAPGTYTVTVTNNLTSCSAVTSIVVTSNAIPQSPIITKRTLLCNPNRVKLEWSGSLFGTYRIRWRSQTNNVWSSYNSWTNVGNVSTYTTPTLLPNKKYQFQLRFACSGSPVTFSNTVSKTVTTPSCFSGFVADEVQTPIVANELVTDIRLYPNPTIGVLKLDIPESYETGIMQVVSLEGKVMFEQKVQIGENSFDLSALPTQMYIVIVKSNQNYWTNRFELLH